MFYRDHNPPHLHAANGDHEAIIDIEHNEIMEVIYLLVFGDLLQNGQHSIKLS